MLPKGIYRRSLSSSTKIELGIVLINIHTVLQSVVGPHHRLFSLKATPINHPAHPLETRKPSNCTPLACKSQRQPPGNQKQASDRRHRAQKPVLLGIESQGVDAAAEHGHACGEKGGSDGVMTRDEDDGRVDQLVMSSRRPTGNLVGVRDALLEPVGTESAKTDGGGTVDGSDSPEEGAAHYGCLSF